MPARLAGGTLSAAPMVEWVFRASGEPKKGVGFLHPLHCRRRGLYLHPKYIEPLVDTHCLQQKERLRLMKCYAHLP